MTIRTTAMLVSVATLAACATAQENPNYKYSSKYQENAPVQVASTAPATVPVVFEAPAAISETEAAFDADTMEGTPGYAIMVEDNAPTSAPVPAPVAATQGGPRAVAYDYSDNVIIADADTPVQPTEVRRIPAPMAGGYTVVPGDTVYSISRRLCVGVGEVTAPNAIGADYAIQIGQTLNLPASRC